MPDCSTCGKRLRRVHRTALEKLWYSAAYNCPQCVRRDRVPHEVVVAPLGFFFSRHTRCPQCGTPNIHRENKPDRIDSVSNHPVSLIQQLSGAPLYHCRACRLQYYDWRLPRPIATEALDEQPARQA